MSENTNCLVCEQNNHDKEPLLKVIWESSAWVLHHDLGSPVLGWLILQPRRCVQGVSKLTRQEASEFGSISRDVALGMELILNVPKVYSLSFGERVSHLHAHFVPRYPDMPEEYLAFGIGDLYRDTLAGLREPPVTKDLDRVICKLKKYFSANPPLS